MKGQRPIGLVAEGNATSSMVLRLPSISEELGPVKAGVLRVARRLSNFLRAGYAVNTYEDLEPARLIFLRVPDVALPRVLGELCASELVLKDVAFVLCESCLSTNALKTLQTRGALTATIAPVQTPRKNWFVIEGQAPAVRQARKFLQRNGARVFELRPGTKPLYFAAQLLAASFPVQLFVAAQQSLRAAGISGNHLYELLEEMSFEMFRSFSNGARFGWPEGRSGCRADTAREYLEDLRSHHPAMAAILDEQFAHVSRDGGIDQQSFAKARESSAS